MKAPLHPLPFHVYISLREDESFKDGWSSRRYFILKFSRYYHIRVSSHWWKAWHMNFSWWWWCTWHKVDIFWHHPKFNLYYKELRTDRCIGQFHLGAFSKKNGASCGFVSVAGGCDCKYTEKEIITSRTLVGLIFFHLCFVYYFSFTLYFRDGRKKCNPTGPTGICGVLYSHMAFN